MSEPIQITNSGAIAISRLLSQYRGKATVEGLVWALTAGFDEVEQALFDIRNTRFLAVAGGLSPTGVALARLGKLVGIAKGPAQTDLDYLTSIKVQIIANVSNGEPGSVVAAFTLLTGATNVFNWDANLGSVVLMGNAVLTQAQVNTFVPLLEQILLGGARIDSIGFFDPVSPFSLSGGPFVTGFGDGTGAGGGYFATALRPNNKIFTLGGGSYSANAAGLGSPRDPMIGGGLAAS